MHIENLKLIVVFYVTARCIHHVVVNQVIEAMYLFQLQGCNHLPN